MNLTEERKKELRERIDWIDKKYLLPVSRARGMRDCTVDWYGGYANAGLDFVEFLRECSELTEDGRLRFVRFATEYAPYVIEADDYLLLERLKNYPMYLCRDGRVRYRYDPEVERFCAREAHLRFDEEWEKLNAWLLGEGYEYIEEEYCWRHPETGDEMVW